MLRTREDYLIDAATETVNDHPPEVVEEEFVIDLGIVGISDDGRFYTEEEVPW